MGSMNVQSFRDAVEVESTIQFDNKINDRLMDYYNSYTNEAVRILNVIAYKYPSNVVLDLSFERYSNIKLDDKSTRVMESMKDNYSFNIHILMLIRNYRNEISSMLRAINKVSGSAISVKIQSRSFFDTDVIVYANDEDKTEFLNIELPRHSREQLYMSIEFYLVITSLVNIVVGNIYRRT